jgi:hypothetical protein
MSKIIATVNEGTRLTNGRIRKFIPDLAVWAVPGLLIDVKAKGPRNVNGVRITYVDASQPLNTNSTHYGVFIISQDEESIQAAADEAAAEVAKTNEIHAAHDRAAATVASVDDANGALASPALTVWPASLRASALTARTRPARSTPRAWSCPSGPTTGESGGSPAARSQFAPSR